jgi:hypothetical protein
MWILKEYVRRKLTLHHDVIAIPPVFRSCEHIGLDVSRIFPTCPLGPVHAEIPGIPKHVCAVRLVRKGVLPVCKSER